MGIATIGVELEGAWGCTCPVRNAADASVEYELETGKLWYSGATRGLETALTLSPEILKIIASKDQILPCRCIPSGIRSDSSVKVSAAADYIGELSPDRPQTPETIGDWITQNYPTTVNMTCGLHVHMKFHDHESTYNRLAQPATEQAIVKGLTVWGQAMKIPIVHPFWRRLAGGNSFCKRGVDYAQIEQQREMDEHYIDARYYAINFPETRLGTMEIRVLPMFKEAKTAVKAVHALIRIMNKWIEECPPSTPPPIEENVCVTSNADAIRPDEINNCIIATIDNSDVSIGLETAVMEAYTYRVSRNGRRSAYREFVR